MEIFKEVLNYEMFMTTYLTFLITYIGLSLTYQSNFIPADKPSKLHTHINIHTFRIRKVVFLKQQKPYGLQDYANAFK